MDRYKFRGLRTDGKGWVYGDLATYMDGSPMIMPKCYFATRDFDEEDEDGTPVIQDDMALGGFFAVIPESVGQLLHIEKNGREWYEGDLAKMDINVPPSNYHDGNGWLNNDDGFQGYAIGEVAFHVRHGLCLKNYKLFDLDTDEEVVKISKFKTICLSRTTIIGNIHTQDGGQEG